MRVFFPCFRRRNLPCFSSHAAVGGGHPRAGDRCGRVVGHAEWRREGSQGQGRYWRLNTYDTISHNIHIYCFFYLFLCRIYWLTVLNPLRWVVLFIYPVLLFHFVSEACSVYSCLNVGLCLRAAGQDSRDAEALHPSKEMMTPASLRSSLCFGPALTLLSSYHT